MARHRPVALASCAVRPTGAGIHPGDLTVATLAGPPSSLAASSQSRRDGRRAARHGRRAQHGNVMREPIKRYIRTAQTFFPWLPDLKSTLQDRFSRVTGWPFEPDFSALRLFGGESRL